MLRDLIEAAEAAVITLVMLKSKVCSYRVGRAVGWGILWKVGAWHAVIIML